MVDTIIDILLEYADSNEKISVSQVERIAKDIQSIIASEKEKAISKTVRTIVDIEQKTRQ